MNVRRAAPPAPRGAGSMHRHTLDRLGQAIVGGRYPAGSVVPPEPLLGEQLGISRTVVREAVKSLVAKGLLVTGPKVGTRVLPEADWNWFDPDVVRWKSRSGLSPAFLRDLHELRRAVEPAGARLAARRAGAQDLAALATAYAGMQAAVEQGGDYVAHDLAFHRSLLGACQNRLMLQMGKALGALLRSSFELGTTLPRSAAASLPLHRAVLDAVAAGDPDAAERACLALIDGAQEDIDQVLAARPSRPRSAAPRAARPKRPRLAGA